MIRENVPKESGIYQIVSVIDNKRYIGSSVDMRRRASAHASKLGLGNHANKHLQHAYSKHGGDNFTFKPIIFCAREDLLTYEQQALDTIDNKYNHMAVAGHVLGIPCSPESRAKMSKARKGRKFSDAHKARISGALKGRTYSKERRVATLAGRGLGRYEYAGEQLTLAELSELSGLSSPCIKGRIGRREMSVAEAVETSRETGKASAEAAKKYEYAGEKLTLTELSDLAGRPNSSIEYRIVNCGMSVAEAVETPTITQRNKPGTARYEYKGEQYSLLELSEMSGLSKNCINDRMRKHGMSLAEAVETPSREAK